MDINYNSSNNNNNNNYYKSLRQNLSIISLSNSKIA